jgi:hypothetical protein
MPKRVRLGADELHSSYDGTGPTLCLMESGLARTKR